MRYWRCLPTSARGSRSHRATKVFAQPAKHFRKFELNSRERGDGPETDSRGSACGLLTHFLSLSSWEREISEMREVAFAVQLAVAGFGTLDWLFFHGHNTAFLLHLIGR
jgi:hypothetical protein